MTALTDRLNALVSVKTDNELWDQHTRWMAEYGFDRLIYGYTRYRTSSSLGDPQDWVILTNHQPEYMAVSYTHLTLPTILRV